MMTAKDDYDILNNKRWISIKTKRDLYKILYKPLKVYSTTYPFSIKKKIVFIFII